MGTNRKLTFAALTDVGMKRAGNEDAFIVAEELGLYVVCDGMGGHASGEVASAMTTEGIVDFLRKRAAGDVALPYRTEEGATDAEKVLSNSIQHANDKVYVAGMKDAKLEGMGTTVVAVQEFGDQMILAHVGDSRIYRWRDGSLEQLTRDHSLLNHKLDIGELKTEEDIKGFKHGNIIVRAIGLKDYVRPETNVTDRAPGDVLLLCSDGLTDLVDDWAIENVVEANHDALEEASSILIRMANDRGGKDNITVILIRVDDLVPKAEVEGEFGYAADEFRSEETVPSSHDETTQPTRKKFELEDDDDDDDDDDDEEEEEKTKPHTPVFMWDDLDDGDGKADDPLGAKTKPVPKIGARHRATEPMATVTVDDASDGVPSIIIDE